MRAVMLIEPIMDLLRRQKKVITPILVVLSLILLTLSVLVLLHRGEVVTLFEETRPVGAISPEISFAYKAHLGVIWMSSHDGSSSALVLEDGVPLGPGNSLHDDIRKKGEGRFSFWHDTLYFSASDNSDPRTNGKKYEIKWPVPIRRRIAYPIYALTLGTVMLACLFALSTFKRRSAESNGETAGTAASEQKKGRGGHEPVKKKISFRDSLMMKLILVSVSVLLTLIILEVFFRFYNPSEERQEMPAVPNSWAKELGWIYEPNKEFEYWVWSRGKKAFTTTQKVNEWGFTDQPVPPSWPTDGLRIMILGDSFAEALQVEMDEKCGFLLESSLREKLGIPVEVVTLGRSGTGQVNQYAFWRKYSPVVNPQILVLVFIQNDLRDNHPELSARYYRWNPLHPPRLYFMLSERGEDGLVEMPIDEDWYHHSSIFPDESARETKFVEESRLINFLVKRIGMDTIKYSWNLNYKGYNVDNAFFAESTYADPVIQSGYRISERILKKYARECKARGTKLLFLVGTPVPKNQGKSGSIDYGIFFQWIAEQASEVDAAYLSMPEIMTEKGLQSNDVIAVDGHWNAKGHILTKDLLEEHVISISKEVLPK